MGVVYADTGITGSKHRPVPRRQGRAHEADRRGAYLHTRGDGALVAQPAEAKGGEDAHRARADRLRVLLAQERQPVRSRAARAQLVHVEVVRDQVQRHRQPLDGHHGRDLRDVLGSGRRVVPLNHGLGDRRRKGEGRRHRPEVAHEKEAPRHERERSRRLAREPYAKDAVLAGRRTEVDEGGAGRAVGVAAAKATKPERPRRRRKSLKRSELVHIVPELHAHYVDRPLFLFYY